MRDFNNALYCLDKARALGYTASALYNSYAKRFRNQKLYDDEIIILKEDLERYASYGKSSEFTRAFND